MARRPASGGLRKGRGAPAGAAHASGGVHVARGAGRPSKADAYNLPTVWTKDGGRPPRERGGAHGVLRGVAGLVGGFFLLVGKGLAAFARAVAALVRRSRVAGVLLALVALLAVAAVADGALNAGKVYAGVHVGEVDLSGATEDEARALLEDAYAQRLAQGTVAVCADEATAAAAGGEADAPLLERPQVVQAAEEGRLWTADAASLEAELDADGLVADALAVGREDGGLWARLQAAFGGRDIPVRARYGAAALEAFAGKIDEAVGDPRVDFGVVVEEGVARVTEGHAGVMLDREAFSRALDGALLVPGGGVFVADAQPAPLRITQDAAQRTCDEVNALIAHGARFTVAGYAWDAAPADVGAWVTTRIEEAGEGYALMPAIDVPLAAGAIQAQAMKVLRDGLPNVSFVRDGDAVMVKTDGTGQMPLSEETAARFDEVLFGPARARLSAAVAAGDAEGAGTGAPSEVGQPVVEVTTQATPTSLTFDEALSRGLVEEISSYTTEYSDAESMANRRHNIHLAADLLSDSIVPANGGVWSFYETSGECNEEAGFLGAGVIIEGEHDDAVGGGICQVATTVFNAVYDSGFPVLRRYNHTLRLTNYPDGRDAAVNWPDLDLRWQNDCASDVLLRCSYTETTLTVTLYGVDPGYVVSTQTGDWQEGEAHKTEVECDESMAEGASYVEVAGVDGSSISVFRTVRDQAGNVLHEDEFASLYQPEAEVVVAGPGTKVVVGEETLVATPGQTMVSKGAAGSE